MEATLEKVVIDVKKTFVHGVILKVKGYYDNNVIQDLGDLNLMQGDTVEVSKIIQIDKK